MEQDRFLATRYRARHVTFHVKLLKSERVRICLRLPRTGHVRKRDEANRGTGRRGRRERGKGDYTAAVSARTTGRPVFVASATAAPAADKKAREFPEILSEGLIAIIIVEWVGVATATWGG